MVVIPKKNNLSVLEEAEEEVRRERVDEAKSKLKAQFRKIEAAREVLRNEERAMDVLLRSIEED